MTKIFRRFFAVGDPISNPKQYRENRIVQPAESFDVLRRTSRRIPFGNNAF
ncbi:MAG: hypothetical protein LBP81_04600 [Treponema sp.]|nr:hypothetical protein [Treponema sp.]